MRAINEDDVIKMLSDGWRSGKYPSASTVRSLPTIEPERAHGHWIHRGAGCFECDQCGELVSTNVYKAEKASDRFKFCPECGVDMREGDPE